MGLMGGVDGMLRFLILFLLRRTGLGGFDCCLLLLFVAFWFIGGSLGMRYR